MATKLGGRILSSVLVRVLVLLTYAGQAVFSQTYYYYSDSYDDNNDSDYGDTTILYWCCHTQRDPCDTCASGYVWSPCVSSCEFYTTVRGILNSRNCYCVGSKPYDESRLDLGSNQVTSIAPGTFDGLGSLTTLDL
eukprot:5212109-Pyramimonas_sp.AAC.1